ncbi:hypothetical protein J1902_05215 [Arthrobacter sp. PO-11]|uniref:PknH-like extracellular domain-containing protein n=1 Tax=Arthrobacter cavernae TaxID=2817681 RepID=A0A939HGD1_9MICC|nr:hypothetical protein [Arthrobacter cavernae]
MAEIKDARGARLSVTSSANLSGSMEQSKALLSSMTVEPAECQEMALAGMPPSVEGASMAMGTSLDATAGASTVVSLTSGLDTEFLKQSIAQFGEVNKCASMSMTTSGAAFDVALTMLNGLGSVPETIAYRTDTTLPDGRKQSLVTAQVVHRGVLMTVIATGGKSEEDAVARVGAILDQAAALVK